MQAPEGGLTPFGYHGRMRPRLLLILAVVLVWTTACGPHVSGNEQETRVIAALARSLEWLERYPADTESAVLGNIGFDTWSWYLFSVWHPDAEVRERAGTEVDRRLRALKPPREWNQVSLSYWAVLLRIGQLHGAEIRSDLPIPAGRELHELLSGATPTTAWWIQELLRHAGLPAEPDASRIFIETAPGSPSGYTPTVIDAYLVFHEIVPATDLGLASFEVSAIQLEFIRGALPGWIDASRAKGDTDALAEVLVVAALVGERNAIYDDALAWLLTRHQEDGTYVVTKARKSVDDYRHVVLVGSWALLTSLDRFEPRVKVDPDRRLPGMRSHLPVGGLQNKHSG